MPAIYLYNTGSFKNGGIHFPKCPPPVLITMPVMMAIIAITIWLHIDRCRRYIGTWWHDDTTGQCGNDYGKYCND
jgi:hypothetical protein